MWAHLPISLALNDLAIWTGIWTFGPPVWPTCVTITHRSTENQGYPHRWLVIGVRRTDKKRCIRAHHAFAPQHFLWNDDSERRWTVLGGMSGVVFWVDTQTERANSYIFPGWWEVRTSFDFTAPQRDPLCTIPGFFWLHPKYIPSQSEHLFRTF